jgi:hypothetical protein
MAKMSKPQLLKRAAALGLAVDASMTNKDLGAAIRKREQEVAKAKAKPAAEAEHAAPSLHTPDGMDAFMEGLGKKDPEPSEPAITVVVTEPDPTIPDVLPEAVEFAPTVSRKPKFVRLPRRGAVPLD